MARAFFEKLWWHDQVVFDTSARETEPNKIHSENAKMVSSEDAVAQR
jgi:hypothetical protein